MSLLQDTISQITPADEITRIAACDKINQLAMPPWAMGRVLDLALDLAGITRSTKPPLARRLVTLMAGDHGIVEEGVTAFPSAVTVGIVATAVKGGAGVSVLSRQMNADVLVVDMGIAGDVSFLEDEPNFLSCPIAKGTANFAKGPAMTPEQAEQAVETGIKIALDRCDDYDVFITGEMGIGNTSPATAIVCAITGCPAADATGRGAGLDDDGLRHKMDVITSALLMHKPDQLNGLDVLSKVGGFEIGGLAGMIIGAASRNKPIVVDGFISTAAALIAQSLCPAATDYMLVSHKSVEVGHEAMLKTLGKEALFDLSLRLGEGTGAVLALPFLDAAAGLMNEMFTLPEALEAGRIQL